MEAGGEAEAKAKALGYEVRRSKIEGSCYEVYGVKEGKLYELFYSPEDLSLKQTIAKRASGFRARSAQSSLRMVTA